MCLAPSKEFNTMVTWLNTLLNTYNTRPNKALAYTITEQLNKLLDHDDINFCGDKRCDYLNMQRFWQWQAGMTETN